MKKWKQIAISIFVGGGGSIGAAIWLMSDPLSFERTMIAILVGELVFCFVWLVYALLELLEPGCE